MIMWHPMNINDDSAKPWLVKKSFAGPKGQPCTTIDTFMYKGYDPRARRFASEAAAQKRCDELNGK